MIDKHIEEKIRANFPTAHFELINESHRHAGPALDSHFKLILSSEVFQGLSRVKRHQAVYRVLAQELAGPVHALALHLYSPEEWGKLDNGAPDSPGCANNK